MISPDLAISGIVLPVHEIGRSKFVVRLQAKAKDSLVDALFWEQRDAMQVLWTLLHFPSRR